MNRPSITQEFAPSNKRYSFLNVLDNVATSSVGLTFAPAFMTANSIQHQERVNACKRLSKTLQTLTTREHGHKHLPELPVPSYDNSTIDISPTSCSNFCSDVVSTRTGLEAPRSTPQEPKNRQHLPLASLGRAFNAYTFGKTTWLHEHTSNDSRNSSRHGSNIAQHSNSDVSVQTSPPDSMYSTPATRRVHIQHRPGSIDSGARAGRARKKSVTYDDQRASRPKTRHSLKCTPSPCSQTTRRGLHFVASLKDWRTKGDKKRRLEEASTTEQEDEHQIKPMLSLKEALRGVAPLSPLHDPQHDKHFTEECSKLLSSGDASRCSFIDSSPAKQLPEPPQEVYPTSSEVVSRPSMHKHTASEAMSVSTSILDLDCPQSGGYKTLRSDETTDLQPARPESPPIPHYTTDEEDSETSSPLISLAASPHLDSFPKMWTAPIVEKRTARSPPPSAPPERPLPRLPTTKIKANTKQKLNSAATRHRPTAEDSSRLWGKPSSTTCGPALAQSRLSILATNKGLRVGAGVASRAGNLSQSGKEQSAAAASPSPSNLRFVKSNRNSRVNELKRRHVSMLIKDGVNVVAFGTSGVDTADFARRGSAPDAMQTSSVHSSHSVRPSPGRRRVSIDKHKPLPLKPASKSHSATSSVSSISARPHISTCGRNSMVNIRSKQDGRLSSGPASHYLKQTKMLSQSNVMTLVDTDPRASHGFRAGAVSPSPGRTCKRTTRKGSRSTLLSHTRSTSIDGSRSSSCQSSMQCWSPSSDSSNCIATAITTVPPSPHSASFIAEVPLVASFDSGYASGNDSRATGADGSRRRGTGIEVLARRSRELDNQERVDASRSNAVVSDNNGEKTVEELKDEVDRMKRVYNAMLRARQGLAQEYMNNKRYAELLEDDGGCRTASFGFQTSNVLEKIEADLASILPKADGDSERTITPSSLRKPVTAISSAPNRKGDTKDDVACSMSANAAGTPAAPHIPSNPYPTPPSSLATTDTSIESPAPLPLKAGSTLLSATRRPAHPTARHPQTSTPKPHSKRYSIMSQYNPYPPPQRSSSTVVAAASPPRAIPGRLPSKQVAICPRTPAQDIDQELDLISAVPPFLTNTRQMDRAIDAFKASTGGDLTADGRGAGANSFED